MPSEKVLALRKLRVRPKHISSDAWKRYRQANPKAPSRRDRIRRGEITRKGVVR